MNNKDKTFISKMQLCVIATLLAGMMMLSMGCSIQEEPSNDSDGYENDYFRSCCVGEILSITDEEMGVSVDSFASYYDQYTLDEIALFDISNR